MREYPDYRPDRRDAEIDRLTTREGSAMTEPQTPSGRALLENWYPGEGDGLDQAEFREMRDAIARVEAESRAAVLDALEAAVRALEVPTNIDVERAAVLEAIQQQRRPTND